MWSAITYAKESKFAIVGIQDETKAAATPAFELGLKQAQMAQKPVLRLEVSARAVAQ